MEFEGPVIERFKQFIQYARILQMQARKAAKG